MLGNIWIARAIIFSVAALLTWPLWADDKLRLWNTLGSEAEVLNSQVGPDLEFYDPTLHGTTGCCDLVGVPAYVDSPFNKAVTLGDGPYLTPYRIHNVVLNNPSAVVNSEAGAISAWYLQTESPVGFSHGVYRIFDGGFGLLRSPTFFPNVAGPRVWVGARLYFEIGNASTGLLVQVRSLDDGEIGHALSGIDDQWLHLLAVWDRAGIEGTTETLRLYVNGTKVAVSTKTTWGTEIGRAVDIAGGNDENIAFKFAVDELKIWGFANVRDAYQVIIDVKPNDPANHINPRANGLFGVELYGTPVFDVREVKVQSVELGPGGAQTSDRPRTIRDIDKDGYADLRLQFRMSDLGLSCDQTSVELTGELEGGLAFYGNDDVTPVGCNSGS